ncbi:MAG TPA: SigE family RNA polymerase sigma factor [Micromonosporaceae bacterium]
MDRFDGFDEFVLTRGPALARTAYLLTGDRHLAEELLQTALTRTAERWRQVAAGGQAEAYVRRAMVNQRTSWWRRRRTAQAYQPPDPGRSGGSGGLVVYGERLGPVADHAQRSADRITLAQALATLAPRQRAIIVLRFYEDYSVAETAEALGCTNGTVKSQTHDALRRLRALLPDLAVDHVETRS